MNHPPGSDENVRLDPLVRTYLVQEIRKIVQEGPGSAASPEIQTSSFDREWFVRHATFLENKLGDQFILLPEGYVNGRDFLYVVQEAYADAATLGMRNPCISAETFHLMLQASYSGDQPLTFQPPVPMGRSNAGASQRFPTPGMSDLFETFGISGTRSFPYGNTPSYVSPRLMGPGSSVNTGIVPGNQAQEMDQTESSFQTYGMSHVTGFEDIPDDMLFAPSLDLISPTIPEGSGSAGRYDQQPSNPLPVDPDLMIGLEITEAGVQPSQENPPDALPNIQLPWAGQGTIPFDPTIGDSGLWPENDRIPPEMQRSYAEYLYSPSEFGPPSMQGLHAETSTTAGNPGSTDEGSYAALFSAPPPFTESMESDPPMYPPRVLTPPMTQEGTEREAGEKMEEEGEGEGEEEGNWGDDEDALARRITVSTL